MASKGWKQRKHGRISVRGKRFSAGTKTKKENQLWQKKLREDKSQSRIGAFETKEEVKNVEDDSSKYSQHAVFKGLLCDTEEHKQSLYDGLKEMGFHAPKIIATFRTLPGQGGEGGRSEVLVAFHTDDLGKLAVSPMHLSGGFSWDDDYYANNKEIIPEDIKKKYFSNMPGWAKKNEEEQEDEEEYESEKGEYHDREKKMSEKSTESEKSKPHLKLVGEDGNAFFILGRAQRTARNAGWSKEKIDEMMKKAQSGNYDHLLQVMMEYFDVD
jgi:hypothetical protein